MLLQQLAQISELRGLQFSLGQDAETSRRGIEKNLVLAFHPAEVVLPSDVAGATVPMPVSRALVEIAARKVW